MEVLANGERLAAATAAEACGPQRGQVRTCDDVTGG